MEWLEERIDNLSKHSTLFSVLVALSAGLPLATDSITLKVAGISMYILLLSAVVIDIISIKQDIKKLHKQIDNAWSDKMGRN